MDAGFNTQQLDEIKQTFGQFDTNGDGHISIDELENAMRQCGKQPSKLEVKMLMNQVDKDRNGVITLEEFIEYMSAPPVLNTSNNDLKARFEIFDKDGDGYITKEEMSSIVAELELGRDFPQEVIDAIFNEADANNDGMISLEEFTSAMI